MDDQAPPLDDVALPAPDPVPEPDLPPDVAVFFAVWDGQTGRILRTGTCPASALPYQAGPGQVVGECPPDVTDETHFYAGGVFLAYPPQPGPDHRFDYAAGAWVLDADKAAAHLAFARRAAAVRTAELVDTYSRRVTGDVAEVERSSWGTKADAARALLAGTATDVQRNMIAVEAQMTAVPPEALAKRVAEKAAAYQMLVAAMTGARISADRRIEAATDLAGVDLALSELDRTLAALIGGKHA
jgi:hypothetical protein